MKKLLGIALVLGLGLMLVNGCQTATETSTSTTAPAGVSVAGSVGDMLSLSAYVDAIATGSMGISISSVNTTDLKTFTVATDLTYDDATDWWTFSYTSGIYSYTFKARAYTAAGAPITTEPELSNTNKLEIVCTMAMGSSLTFHFGTDLSPLTFNGLDTGTKSLNGTIDYSITESGGSSYSITIVYTGVTLDGSGLPNGGSASFSFSSSDYATVAATLTFNGNGTATLSFTSPTELAGTSYNVDLLTGDVL